MSRRVLDSRTFNESVWAVLQQIPPGWVTSYGRVADLAGFPGRARQVASALRAAPETLNLPWHRVVCASGRLGLPRGTGDHEEQVSRLCEEGVSVRDGRVEIDACLWRGYMDSWLWGLDGQTSAPDTVEQGTTPS